MKEFEYPFDADFLLKKKKSLKQKKKLWQVEKN